jgi:hypothetical protein
MILAHYGAAATEAELVRTAGVRGGIDPDDLARLAVTHGFHVRVEQLDADDLATILEHGVFPIVYVDRLPIDGEFAVHAVIPTRISPRFIWCLDPLRGDRRIGRRKFAEAERRVGRWCVIASRKVTPPENG